MQAFRKFRAASPLDAKNRELNTSDLDGGNRMAVEVSYPTGLRASFGVNLWRCPHGMNGLLSRKHPSLSIAENKNSK